MSEAPSVICPYCGGPAKLLGSSESLYHGQNYGPVWICSDTCDARVGADRQTLQPLGRLANKELRALKIKTHALFDPLWRHLEAAYPELTVFPKWIHSQARARAYAWLADQIGIAPDDCHIAMFDDYRCRAAIHFIESRQPTSATIRAWAKARKEKAA